LPQKAVVANLQETDLQMSNWLRWQKLWHSPDLQSSKESYIPASITAANLDPCAGSIT
jgi:hypothetical protein